MSKQLTYMPKLDGLRAIAAIMVLIAHYLEDLKSSVSFSYGGNGVQIFFTISGFLITYILISQKNKLISISKMKQILIFMLKRALRLFPIYYLFITSLFILSKYSGLWLCKDGTGWYYFCYLQNYLFYILNFQSNLLNHTWSLAVEEQFYLLWPFLIFFIPKKHELKLLIIVFMIGIISKFYFYYYYTGIGTTKGITLMHFDTLGIGSILAYVIYYQKKSLIIFLEKKSTVLFIILFSLTVVFTMFKLNEFLLSLFLAFMSVLLVFMASSQKSFFLDYLFNLKPLIYLGKISYGIYLYHKPVPFLCNALLNKLNLEFSENKIILFSFYASISILIAVISWYVIERFFIKMKDKIDIQKC